MALSGYLLDTSVIHRLGSDVVRSEVESRGVDRLLYRCAVTELEVLRSAPSPESYVQDRASMQSRYADLEITPGVLTAALEAQGKLAEHSQHRGIPLPDLIIAACAQTHDATVLHYDADYDRIAEVTGQPAEWVVPSGSVD